MSSKIVRWSVEPMQVSAGEAVNRLLSENPVERLFARLSNADNWQAERADLERRKHCARRDS